MQPGTDSKAYRGRRGRRRRTWDDTLLGASLLDLRDDLAGASWRDWARGFGLAAFAWAACVLFLLVA